MADIHRNIKKRRKEDRKIAYFSMEIGLDAKIPVYSGGLGVLAGDTIKSCADLNVPLVAVSLLYKKGYFSQELNQDGQQQELPCIWEPRDFMTLLPEKVTVTIGNRTVFIQAWQYIVKGASDYFVPIIFLDTDLEQNSEYDRSLTHHLYGGEEKYRLSQEIVLGIGGVRMLKELAYNHISIYHMNEGHASLLSLELLKQLKEEEGDWDFEAVRKMCVFTTHTPVPAGHDQFSYDLVKETLGELIPFEMLLKLGGEHKLNMTLLALNLSDYVNGVAKEHRKVSQEMFPGYYIESITNGIHSYTWTIETFKKLYDKYIPGWKNDSFSLRYALSIPREEVWEAHYQAKKQMIDYINNKNKLNLSAEVFTIGFARRATAYKRADLIFYDKLRLSNIAKSGGKIQLIFSGKAHPKDWPGKELIKKIISASGQFDSEITIAYMENYDMELAKMLISGVDLWLNNPKRPKEASGTSGMKAAHNGIPSLSILDGWWIEGCIEGITGWSIGTLDNVSNSDEQDAIALYEKLEKIIYIFYQKRQWWVDIMRHAIAMNASFFNTHRMIQQYVLNAYLY